MMKKKNINYILVDLALLLVFADRPSFFNGKNSLNSQTVQASSRLKKSIYT
ncbi:hypothetical protein [Lactobacillus helveticus]|uniref:hypothetical protein n=1 Tax=Lactobacillus helveticus TaxID=1587 RepID=UPI0013FD6EFB|nr:hypothetical protein [Lactobacillus helveticus]